MARKKKHEEHQNHEAWAIPYGDLVTLLLALFVVMYAMSSVNEGKYRILSDSLVAAFRGSPKTLEPVNIGQDKKGKDKDSAMQGVKPTALMKLRDAPQIAGIGEHEAQQEEQKPKSEDQSQLSNALIRMERDVEEALQSLIDKKLVVVRREQLWLEVEIRTDILFGSGASKVSRSAEPVLDQLAGILKPFANPVRVEGHTDNRPIKSSEFPSNWELSAARAASVVHLFTKAGMDPQRLEIIGLGEFRPIADNATQEGRNSNRRVRIVILEGSGKSEEVYAANRRDPSQPAVDGQTLAGTEPQVAEPGGNRSLFTVQPTELQNASDAPKTATPVPSGKPANTVYVEPPRTPTTP